MTRDLHAWLRVEPDFGRIKEPQRVPSILLIHQFFGVKHGVSNTNLFFFYLKKTYMCYFILWNLNFDGTIILVVGNPNWQVWAVVASLTEKIVDGSFVLYLDVI